MIVYLGHPICAMTRESDRAEIEWLEHTIEHVRNYALDQGLSIFTPADAWFNTTARAKMPTTEADTIAQIDLTAAKYADLGIFILPRIVTVGTIVEINYRASYSLQSFVLSHNEWASRSVFIRRFGSYVMTGDHLTTEMIDCVTKKMD